MRKPADVDQAFEYAKAAGMRVIVAMPIGPDAARGSTRRCRSTTSAWRSTTTGRATRSSPRPTWPTNRSRTLDRRVGLCIDIGHTLRIGGDPYRAAEQFADRLFDVHMKDIAAAATDDYRSRSAAA